jgi:hypothetical protein
VSDIAAWPQSLQETAVHLSALRAINNLEPITREAAARYPRQTKESDDVNTVVARFFATSVMNQFDMGVPNSQLLSHDSFVPWRY